MRKKSRGKSLDINGPWLSAAACMFAETWSQLLLPYLNIPRSPHPSLQTTLLSSMTLKTFHPALYQIRGAFCYINSAKFGSRYSVRLNSRTAEVSHISTCNNNVPLIWVIRTHMYVSDKKIKVRKIALISVVSVCGETKFRIISQMGSIYELLAQDVVYYIWELVWRGKAMSVLFGV